MGKQYRVLWAWLLCAPAAASAFCVPLVAFAGVPAVVGRRAEGARLGRIPLFSKRKAPARVQPHVDVNKKFPGLKQVNKDPAIFTIDNFFDGETCNRYLELGPAGEASGQSLKVDSATFGGGFTAQNRQSTTWFLRFASARELVAGALKLLPDRVLENCEEPQIVRYEMGDYFNWHEDALPMEEIKSNAANGGQRVATLLVYLNDVPQSGGGATAFKHLNVKVTPQKLRRTSDDMPAANQNRQGKALLFFPAFANGAPDSRTEHAGSAAFDTKWIAQMWIHQNDYKPAVPSGNSHSDLADLAD